MCLPICRIYTWQQHTMTIKQDLLVVLARIGLSNQIGPELTLYLVFPAGKTWPCQSSAQCKNRLTTIPTVYSICSRNRCAAQAAS